MRVSASLYLSVRLSVCLSLHNDDIIDTYLAIHPVHHGRTEAPSKCNLLADLPSFIRSIAFIRQTPTRCEYERQIQRPTTKHTVPLRFIR